MASASVMPPRNPILKAIRLRADNLNALPTLSIKAKGPVAGLFRRFSLSVAQRGNHMEA